MVSACTFTGWQSFVEREYRINQSQPFLALTQLFTNTKFVALIVEICVSRTGLCCSIKYNVKMIETCTRHRWLVTC